MSTILAVPTTGWSSTATITTDDRWTYVAVPGAGGSISAQWSADGVEWIGFAPTAQLTGSVPAAALYVRAIAKVAAGTLTLTEATPDRGELTDDQVTGIDDGSIVAADGTIYALSEIWSPATLLTYSASSQQVSATPCEYGGFRVAAVTGTVNVTAYDSTDGSGTAIHTQAAVAVGGYPWLGAGTNARRENVNGLSIKMTGGGTTSIEPLYIA